MDRGVIAAPMNYKFRMTGVEMSTYLTPEMIRYYLLYWDKIVVPDNNLVSVRLPDEDDLIKCNVVLRPKSSYSGSFSSSSMANLFMHEQIAWANFFKRDPNVDWVIHQSDSSQIYLPDDESVVRDSIRMSLSKVLPVPDKEVNINEVLEFKAFRKAELEALHASVDEMYMEILRQPDQELAQKLAVDRFKSSIDDLDKVTKERFGLFNKFNFETQYSLNMKDLIGFGAGGGAAEIAVAEGIAKVPALDVLTSYDFPVLTMAGVAAGFVSGISVSVGLNRAPKIGDSTRLSYLAKASDLGLITL